MRKANLDKNAATSNKRLKSLIQASSTGHCEVEMPPSAKFLEEKISELSEESSTKRGANQAFH